MHTSLSAFGYIPGGEYEIVKMLKELVAQGNIIMAAQTNDLSDPSEWGEPPATVATQKNIFVKHRGRFCSSAMYSAGQISAGMMQVLQCISIAPSSFSTFFSPCCFTHAVFSQDLLSIANVAEQHEVWDFLSGSSKVFIVLTLVLES